MAHADGITRWFCAVVELGAGMSNKYSWRSPKKLVEDCASQSWLVEDICPAGSIGMIVGKPATFKSFVAIDLALSIGHGLPWCNKPTQRGVVLYICGEGGGAISKRIHGWYLKHGIEIATSTLRIGTSPLLLDNAADKDELSAELERCIKEGSHPQLVIVDTVSTNFSGDEDSAEQVGSLTRALAELRDRYAGCSFLLVHHTGHSETSRPRGSSAFIGNADFIYICMRSNLTVELKCSKMKDAEESDPLSFKMECIELPANGAGNTNSTLVARFEGYGESKTASTKRRASIHDGALLGVLKGFAGMPVTKAMIKPDFEKNVSGIKPENVGKTLDRALESVCERGLAYKTDDDRYRLAEATGDDSEQSS